MVRTDSVEIYTREINVPETLDLFLKCRLYGCRHEPHSRLAEAHYFAPHFGRAVAQSRLSIRRGSATSR